MPALRIDRSLTGTLIVIVGVLLLLSTTDAVATESLWDFLPAVFVALGVWALVKSGFRNFTGPIMVIAVGVALQLRNLGYLTNQQLETWWPLFVVLFGLLVLVGRSRRGHGTTTETRDGSIDLISFFGGTKQHVAGTFHGAEIFALFGGSELDLRDATADDATIECFMLFGGTEVAVPDAWNVRLDVLSLFGATEDERAPTESTDGYDLTVTGLVLFGGVSVTR